MNSSELSPADIAAVTGGNNGGMFGGDGSWLAILFLFALFGWGTYFTLSFRSPRRKSFADFLNPVSV